MSGHAPSHLRLDQAPEQTGASEDINVILLSDEDGAAVSIDPSGAVEIENADGSVTVDLAPASEDNADAEEHDANLAEHIAQDELSRICEDLIQGYEADEASRQEWLQTRAEGIKLLGLKLETPGQATDGTAGESVSKVDHPLLLEAVLRFQANARGELLPVDGPVKVRDDDATDLVAAPPPMLPAAPAPKPPRDQVAEALEKDLNHYLTTTAREYYPDTDRMLLYVGFGGCAFKKVYRCPIRRRPVSESVDAKDIVVSNAATDMANAGRITHRISMRPSTVKRMQLAGAYRDLPTMAQASPQPNAVDQKIAETQGVAAVPQLPEDADRTILEIYCELDIKGYEHVDDDGEVTGLAIPYVVVIDKDDRSVLAIRRNYEEDDPFCIPKIPFVKYSFVPGLGFYDLGLVHMLGNTTRALTGVWRIGLDAGMFANFPGFLYLASAMRQATNQFRVPPGGGSPIQSTATSIKDAVMPLPYHEMGPGLMQLADNMAQTGQRVGGTADVMVGEGRQDAPVGTTIALIEQATKVLDAVHKRLHTAQAEEFGLLKALFADDPTPLWRRKKSQLAKVLNLRVDADDAQQEQAHKAIAKALDDNDLVPVADPNTPSHVHRIMKAVAIKQLQAASPGLYDVKKVDERIMQMIGVENPEDLFAPPAPPQGAPGPSPDKLVDAHVTAETKAAELASRERVELAKLADNNLQRESDEKLAVMDLARTLAVHPEAEGLIRRTVGGEKPAPARVI